MSNKYSSGSVSEDFPLYHNENIPVYSPIKEKKHKKNISNIRIMVSNEHPDIFRIKGIKEGGYMNPFLNEVLKVDRDEYFKKMQEIGKKIKLIDVIKSSRKYSQDPKYFSLINNDEYYKSKNTIEYSKPEIYGQPPNFSLSLDSNNNFLNNALRTLNKERKRITRNNTKKNIDLDKMKKIGDNFIINQNDINKIKNVQCSFNLDKSSYISNLNNFEFSEIPKEDENKEFFYPRKPVYKLNPIMNTKTLLYPPPYIFPKWSNFAENYFVLSQTKNGLKRKGGLFSEFVNKNFDKLKVINDDIKKRLKQKREEEKMRRNFSEIYNNISRNIFKSFTPKFSSFEISNFSNSKYRKNLLFEKMNILKNKSYKSIFELQN